MVGQFRIIAERRADGYPAYPISLKGVIVGEGECHEEALADVRTAMPFMSASTSIRRGGYEPPNDHRLEE